MGKIVVAGESGEVLGVLEAELQGEGHEVVLASNGHEAYELTLSERPQAVFLEPRMSVFDGLTTCRMIRDDPDTPPELPVFLLGGERVDPKALERAEVTEVISARHESGDLRELLARHLSVQGWDAQ